MILYRYDDYVGPENSWTVQLVQFQVIRETRACYVIDYGPKGKYILRGTGKRFAYPTIELARQSFEIRKRRQLGHLTIGHDRISSIVAAIEAGTVYNEPKRYKLFSEDFL